LRSLHITEITNFSVSTLRSNVNSLLSDLKRIHLSGGRNALNSSSTAADEHFPQRSFVGSDVFFTFIIAALIASVPGHRRCAVSHQQRQETSREVTAADNR